jgi:hypothetical protein
MSDKTKSKRHALAIDHVERGRVFVARQRKLVAEIRYRNGDCSRAEDLLSTFERSQSIFEDDLRRFEERDEG